jgi:glutathionyl-hydroquinone reductase
MASFNTSNDKELQKIESHLAKHQFLGGNLPTQDDVRVYWSLSGAPDKAKYPNFYACYATLSNFSAGAMK